MPRFVPWSTGGNNSVSASQFKYMNTELLEMGNLRVTSFYGGNDRGRCIQFTTQAGDGHAQFTKSNVETLVSKLNEWLGCPEANVLRENVQMLRDAMELFCQRRDRGEIQSSTTYKQFKQLLEDTRL